MLLSERIGGDITAPNAPRSAEAEAVRQRIREGLQGGDNPR